ncbi:YciN family protein [Yersinia ruckeri]
MHNETTPVQREALLAEANEIIRQHEDYLHGMLATEVEQKGPVLVFRGEFFLDTDGLPTRKTTAVFNMFKHLAHVLSAKYHLVD